MPTDLRSFPNNSALAEAAANDWLDWLQAVQARSSGSPIRVALSGGRIARDFFQETVRQFRSRPGPKPGSPGLFSQVHFFWADERCVPPTDPESNYALARELLFEPLNIAAAQIHRLRGEAEQSRALREGISEISSGSPQSNGQPVLDLVFLGMGEDGHTASLFPGESESAITDPAIYRAVTAVKPPPRRFTLGYGVLLAAREVWVLISGRDKQSALRKTLSSGGQTPLGRVLQGREGSRVYTDLKMTA